MEKGFFVIFKRSRSANAKPANWKSDLIDPIRGWPPTTGGTIDEAIEGQQRLYAARILANESVPELVLVKDSPMASGQIVRFVPIAVAGK